MHKHILGTHIQWLTRQREVIVGTGKPSRFMKFSMPTGHPHMFDDPAHVFAHISMTFISTDSCASDLKQIFPTVEIIPLLIGQ